VKFVRFRRSKATCSLSYVVYRPKTNAEILLDVGHPMGKSRMGGIRQGKETKNLDVVNVLSV
jgi:hypothetical protein